MQEEVASREVYELVLKIALLPSLAFLIWLSWLIINYLFNEQWRQERRNKQILKAQAERQELLAAMKAEEDSRRQSAESKMP